MSDEFLNSPEHLQNRIVFWQNRAQALEIELAEAKGDAASPAWAGDRVKALEAENARLREALECIAESHDAGRHDGLPEPCPAHDAETMFAIAQETLTSSGEPSAAGRHAYEPGGDHGLCRHCNLPQDDPYHREPSAAGEPEQKPWEDNEAYDEWLTTLREDVIEGEFGYEPGEFTVYAEAWWPLYEEQLTPQQAFTRALDAHKTVQRQESDGE